MKITKRDITFYLLGFLTLFLVETILDWDANKKAFYEGYNNKTNQINKQD